MEQNIFDYLVEGLDLNAFYSFIDSKTDIDKNTPKFVFQYTTWSALFNGIIRSDEEDDKKVHVFSTNCQYLIREPSPDLPKIITKQTIQEL
ncbi:MAG: hypothetical protein K6F20_01600 [Bacteroidaceae bacterium]|nr:hypothetical protein [Bacteroidaceae bacterium]